MRAYPLLVGMLLVSTVLLGPGGQPALAESPTDGDGVPAPGWVRILNHEGDELDRTSYGVDESEPGRNLRIRSNRPMQGAFTVLVKETALKARVPDPSIAGHRFETVRSEDGAWIETNLETDGTYLSVTFESFTPKLDVPQYTLGSNRSVRLVRPMFVRLISVPHYENETRVGENRNGTFSHEVEHFVLELGIEFDDMNTTGQPVRISSAWLSGFGFTKPSFRHEDGSPIQNASLGSHWLLEPTHFSGIWVFSVDSEGFSKENDQPNSNVTWDSGNRRIKIWSDRRDPSGESEQFRVAATPFAWDRTTSFTIRATWQTIQQGNWQIASPLFFMAAENDGIFDANTISVVYLSRDSNLGWSPLYRLEYTDAQGTRSILAQYYGVANTQYFFALEYDAISGTLELSMYDVYGNEKMSGSVVITAANSFSVGKVGAASYGTGGTLEPPINAWTDSIFADTNFAKNGDMELDGDSDGLPDSWQPVSWGGGPQAFTFDASDEGFAKETDYPYSDVKWDSANGRVYVKSDRRDAGDEMFTKSIGPLDTSTDFTVTARWRATQQGNWQASYPLFLAGQSNTQVDAANSVSIYYYSKDSNLGQNPRYYMRYRDGTNTLRLNVYYTTQTNTEYHFYINYDASTQVLALEIRDANDATLASASYTLGSNSNDGFAFGKVGVSSHGWSNSWEPLIYAWTDDIVLNTETLGGSISQSSESSYTNTYSVRIEDTSSATKMGIELVPSARAVGGAGSYFKASGWAFSTGGTHHIRLEFRDSTGSLLKWEWAATQYNWMWEYVEITTMAPDETASTSVVLLSTETNVGSAYWDAVELHVVSRFWSINNHDGDAGSGLEGWRKTFDYALDLGVTYVRTDFRWDAFHTGDDSWDTWELAYWQDVISMGRTRGIDLIAILNGPKPAWVPDGDKYWRFWEFCEKMAETFGDQVYYYQILNEVNHPFGHDTSIEGDFPTFINMCNSGLYRGEGVSKANSKSGYKTIINAFVSDATLDWAADMESWVSGADSHIDIVAIDYYPGTWSDRWCHYWKPMDDLASIMSTYSKEGAIMETGISDSSMEGWPACILDTIRDKVRSHDQSYPTLPFLLGNWYELVNDPDAGLVLDNFGLLFADLTPKIGYAEFRTHVAYYKF